MSIDFEIPPEAKAIREKVRQWVNDECRPAEKALLDGGDYKTILGELRTKARAQGLWCPFIPVEHGGMGLGPLANALVQMELGESYLGALSMNTQGPDDATMMTLLAHGTEYQKEKFLKPLLNGEKRICYSMTEKAAGADATGMQTTAVKDGNENYILNGEKWFSSAASVADIALVMAKTDPDAPRHQQFSTFIVELPNPGYRIVRDIGTIAGVGVMRSAPRAKTISPLIASSSSSDQPACSSASGWWASRRLRGQYPWDPVTSWMPLTLRNPSTSAVTLRRVGRRHQVLPQAADPLHIEVARRDGHAVRGRTLGLVRHDHRAGRRRSAADQR
eukprot:gene31294-41699_t